MYIFTIFSGTLVTEYIYFAAFERYLGRMNFHELMASAKYICFHFPNGLHIQSQNVQASVTRCRMF